MKNVKIVSTVLFYITRILAVMYLCIALYSLIVLLTEWSYITKKGGNNFAICFPFTDTPFLVGENNWGYKLFNFLLPIGAYGFFFLVLSNIFSVFRGAKLFTQYGVDQLHYFFLGNIIIPFSLILLASIFAGKIEEGLEWLAVVHFFLGVFAFFMAAIFRQGLLLQKEQDLFI
jgi:hypothetical protein